MRIEQIPRVSEITASTFHADYVRTGEPVFITGSPRLREASNRWSLDYLVSRHPAHVVTVAHFASGNRTMVPAYLRMELGRYIDLVRRMPGERTRYFLADEPVEQALPNTAAEVPPPPILDGCRIMKTATNVGVDTFTNAHYHPTPVEAVLAQVHGRKHIAMYAPDQMRMLKPYPWYSLRFGCSRIPINHSNATTIAPHARGYDCTLEPGDMLFIPQGWFHFVTGDSENISVTYFFQGRRSDATSRVLMRDSAAILHRRLLLAPLLRLGANHGRLQEVLRAYAALGIIRKNELDIWANHFVKAPAAD